MSLSFVAVMSVLFLMLSAIIYGIRQDYKEIKLKREWLEPRLVESIEAKQMITIVMTADSWAKALSPTLIEFTIRGGFFEHDKKCLYLGDPTSGLWEKIG